MEIWNLDTYLETLGLTRKSARHPGLGCSASIRSVLAAMISPDNTYGAGQSAGILEEAHFSDRMEAFNERVISLCEQGSKP